MSQIRYFEGCESDRPKTEVIQMIPRAVILEQLSALRENLEINGDPTGLLAGTWWLLLSDVMDYLGIAKEEQEQVFGPVVWPIYKAVNRPEIVLLGMKSDA